jgi:membrane-associated phospholipid phosphatase
VLGCYLLFAANVLNTSGQAMPQQDGTAGAPAGDIGEEHTNLSATHTTTTTMQKLPDTFIARRSRGGRHSVNSFLSDQQSLWASPTHLRWAAGSWLFPLASVSAGLLATDRAVARSLPSDAKQLKRYDSISNFGLASLVAAGGGLYLWSAVSHDDHQRETGILAGEAAISSAAVNSAFRYSFGTMPSLQAERRGLNRSGTSFPSDHSAVAWSVASVIAHEYPGPLTQFFAYGAAAAVSASRVMARDHAPSDVFVGGAIGWFVGRQIYRARHDASLQGATLRNLSSSEDGEEHRDRLAMGSTFVPLDSWVYTAFDKLAALGFVGTAITGVQPWTRMECARLTEETGEALRTVAATHSGSSALAAGLQQRLEQEFAYETALLGGGRNLAFDFGPAYARTVAINGPALADGYHFGQTISYDFGRPFERGISGNSGGSFRGVAGPLALYVRLEYQHAPASPQITSRVREIIAQADRVPVSQVPSVRPQLDRLALLDAYAAVNLHNWQLVIGRQSLSWGAGSGPMLWSSNIEPVNMVRLVNAEPILLPGLLQYLGPVRMDNFVGRLSDAALMQPPFVYGQKISLKILPSLELGFGRVVTIGGSRSGSPITLNNVLHSYFGIATGRTSAGPGSVPGDSHSEMDWIFRVPKVRNYIVLYGDAYAEDDILPIENPARNPWHPGIYITHLPKLANLDFHMEGVSTEQPGLLAASGGGNHGIFNYWNSTYPNGYTNKGNLIGNTVGRDGRTILCQLTYWLSPRKTLQLVYKHNSIAGDFIPGGARWQDYAAVTEIYLRSGFYGKAQVQYEHISRFPALFSGPQRNVTAIVELGFDPSGIGGHGRARLAAHSGTGAEPTR